MLINKTRIILLCVILGLIGMRPAFSQTQTNTPVTGVDLGGEIFDIISRNPANPTQAINNYMAGVAAMNVHWVRITIGWWQIQPSQSWIIPFDPNPGAASGLTWGTTDTLVRAARNNGLRVLGVITSTPRWAANSACPSSYRQASGAYWQCAPDPTAYTNFAKAAAKHYGSDSYGGRIDAWEIWNEPNCGVSFIPHDPGLYTRILRSVYPAIKQANPGAYVYAGGSSGCTTSPNNGTGALPPNGVAGLVGSTNPAYPAPTQWEPRDWLAAMYANGARGYFDALAHHPHCHSDDWQAPGNQCPSTTLNSTYPDYSNPFNIMWHTFASPSYGWPNSNGYTFASYTGTSLRDLMSANGDGGKAIAITEFGVATTASDGATNFTGRLGGNSQQYTNANFQTLAPSYLTQANQAREYRQMMAWVASQPYGQYGPVYAYSYSDMALSSSYSVDIYEPYFGLATLSPTTGTTGTAGPPKIAGTSQPVSGPYYPAWPNFGAAATAAAGKAAGYAPIGPGWYNAQGK
ncbi:glycoside hydrolase 5 family protein [Burkholderia alba]|uniref:cellulase n=1 Tax=Burkholderia alba TaxID=2683677 RepID=UPI002B053C30|nr:cellulase [Burkholderia alba]